MNDHVSVDCEEGRRLGCKTYCCRLLVRLDPDERGTDIHGNVEKCSDGLCVHLDRTNHLCQIWADRPRVCRSYTCNGDILFQVAIRNQFKTIVDLVRLAAVANIAKDTYINIGTSGVTDSEVP